MNSIKLLLAKIIVRCVAAFQNLLSSFSGKRLPPFCSALGILEKDGKFLVIDHAVYGHYSFPGGYLRINETPSEAVVREFREETGISVLPGALVNVHKNESGVFSINFFFACTMVEQGAEVTGYEGKCVWKRLEEIEDRLLPHCRHALHEYMSLFALEDDHAFTSAWHYRNLSSRPDSAVLPGAYITWSEELSTGYEHIDAQHRHLVRLINHLSDAIGLNVEARSLGGILDELVRYTGYHFRSEETLMRVCSYPGARAHLAEHATFLDRITAITTQYGAQPHLLAENLLDFLKAWFSGHIMKKDKELGNFLAAAPIPDLKTGIDAFFREETPGNKRIQ